MTADERAGVVVDKFWLRLEQYADPATMDADKASLFLMIYGEIRKAEQAMSKYWETTVGQERDELKSEVAKLRQAIQSIPYDQRPTDPHHGGKMSFPDEGN